MIEINHWIPNTPSLAFRAVVTPTQSKANDKILQDIEEADAAARPATANMSLAKRLRPPTRTIIEFCCGKESLIGQTAKFREASGCEVVRITEEIDGRSVAAKRIIQDTVNHSKGFNLQPYVVLRNALYGGFPMAIHKP